MKYIKDKKVALVFLVFFCLILFQHHFMWLYHDDYGYATLSYVGNVWQNNMAGYHTHILDIFEFLKYHYMNWGSRILYFFFECIILRHGIHLFRIVQSIFITGIFYYLYKIMSVFLKKQDWKLALVTCSLYGVFEIMLFRDGVFWITASVLYLFPLLPFFMYIYYFVIKENKGKLKAILSCLLIFIVSFSQEQISAMILAFIGLYFIIDWIKNKKININYLLNGIFAFIGFLILLLCPGSKYRMTVVSDFYSLNLFEKLRISIPNIVFGNFGGYTRIFTILFFAAILYFVYENYKKKDKKIFNALNIASLLSTGVVLIFSVLKYDGFYSWLYTYKIAEWYRLIALCIIFIHLGLISYSIIYYFIKKNNYIIVSLFIASIGSQSVMLITNYFPLRASMIMQYVDFILIIYVIYELLIAKKRFILFIPLLIVLLFNYFEITYGYYKNNYANSYNHNTLIETSKKIKSGEKIEKVVLKKLPLAAYSSNQPYDPNFDYILFYMKVYYELPQDLVIEYE